MFQGPIVAAHEINAADASNAGHAFGADTAKPRGPVAGIVLALPFSLVLWAVILGAARLWF